MGGPEGGHQWVAGRLGDWAADDAGHDREIEMTLVPVPISMAGLRSTVYGLRTPVLWFSGYDDAEI